MRARTDGNRHGAHLWLQKIRQCQSTTLHHGHSWRINHHDADHTPRHTGCVIRTALLCGCFVASHLLGALSLGWTLDDGRGFNNRSRITAFHRRTVGFIERLGTLQTNTTETFIGVVEPRLNVARSTQYFVSNRCWWRTQRWLARSRSPRHGCLRTLDRWMVRRQTRRFTPHIFYC